jgi:predicted CopG family antitoxin
VLNGVVKNARISEAIEKLIEKRKREIEVLVNDFDD